MSAVSHGAPFVPFYASAPGGDRYCIHHPPRATERGGVVYVHPFAEEMNKSRRMAALMARRLAAAGYRVLQMDLYGCGDSAGELREASWTRWKDDVRLALRWLQARTCGPVYLWGLRLGALLGLDVASEPTGCAGHILWQPVTSGEAHLTQFLRMRVAAQALSAGTGTESTAGLREALKRGETVEVAGYDLPPALALEIDRLKLADFAPDVPVHWLEVVADAGAGVAPASRRVADGWIRSGVEVTLRTCSGEPFWSTIEIAECEALVALTLEALASPAYVHEH